MDQPPTGTPRDTGVRAAAPRVASQVRRWMSCIATVSGIGRQIVEHRQHDLAGDRQVLRLNVFGSILGRVVVLAVRTANEIGSLGVGVHEKQRTIRCEDSLYLVERPIEIPDIVRRLHGQHEIEAPIGERELGGRELRQG